MFRFGPSSSKYTVYDVVVYLIKRLGGRVKGVKKLMKLVFLIQYERRNDRVIKYVFKGKPITKAEFYIWSYGPLSNEVYEVIDERLRVDDSDVPVIIKLPTFNINRSEKILPEQVKKRIDYIVEKYGDLHGFELEKISLELLELDELKKSEYMGSSVDNYIRDIFGKDKFEIVDLAEEH